MKLLTSFFDAKNAPRSAELLECWRRNGECAAFDQCFHFLELEQPVTPEFMESWRSVLGMKDVVAAVHKRMTYADYFQYANDTFAPGTAVCLSNSDIWFDETLLNITDQQLDQRTFFACSRWGYMEDIGGWHWSDDYDRNAPVSQDAWIFRTPIMWGADLRFTFGCMRCDNVVAHAMHAAGYRVLNPTLPGPKSLKLRHEHRSQQHNYGETIPGPMIFVHPCHLG